MLMVVAVGVVQLGVLLLFGKLWVGVSYAGYLVRDELPILLVVFAVPAVLAVIVIWQISRS